jgi:hypothetical protein
MAMSLFAAYTLVYAHHGANHEPPQPANQSLEAE